MAKTSTFMIAATLLMGCPDAHQRRAYPIEDARVDDATCTREGASLSDGGPFARRFGPYTPEGASRWLGGSVAWSRDGAVLVAAQHSSYTSRSETPRLPSEDGLVVFQAARSCARATARLEAPTQELGVSLSVSSSGGFIAATGYVPRVLSGGDGFEFTEVAAHSFERVGTSYLSRDAIALSGVASLGFVGERLAILNTVDAPNEVAVFTLTEAMNAVTDVVRADELSQDVYVATSASGEYAAVVGLRAQVTRIRFDGETSSFAPIHEPTVYDGLMPSVAVADTGRVVLFRAEGGRGQIRVLGERGAEVATGWPGYPFNPGAVAITPRGDRIAWTATGESPTGTNFRLHVADVAPDGVISRVTQVSLEEGCETPWFVRSVAFASDGRLAVGAMCGETRGAVFIYEP